MSSSFVTWLAFLGELIIILSGRRHLIVYAQPIFFAH